LRPRDVLKPDHDMGKQEDARIAGGLMTKKTELFGSRRYPLKLDWTSAASRALLLGHEITFQVGLIVARVQPSGETCVLFQKNR
jgi:hypothetical protein